MWPTPDWELTNTRQALGAEVALQFNEPGWYVDTKHADTILLISLGGNQYRMFVWNGRDPRKELRKLLEMPTMDI